MVDWSSHSCVHYCVVKLRFAVPLIEESRWCRGSISARKAAGPGSIPGWDYRVFYWGIAFLSVYVVAAGHFTHVFYTVLLIRKITLFGSLCLFV